MAFIKTSDSILIKATLTEKGKKLLARGKFKVAKFTVADDEVDYRLYHPGRSYDKNYEPALKNTKILEAYKDVKNNIHYSLASYDNGLLYLNDLELEELDGILHANILYLPVLVANNKLPYSPTVRNDKYYVSINDETTKILSEGMPDFKFLQINDHDKIKITIESGIQVDGDGKADIGVNSPETRTDLIVKKFLLDEDFMVYADNRIIANFFGIQLNSQFENYASGKAIINFNTSVSESPAVSLENEFDYFATYLLKGIPNMMFDYETSETKSDFVQHSALNGPRGTLLAFNVTTDNKLKVNSTGTRDARFSELGVVESAVFSEIPTSKFDYIDTTIYVIGASSHSRLQIPLRIIRYAGT